MAGLAGSVLLPSCPAYAAAPSDTWTDSSQVLHKTIPAGVCGVTFKVTGGSGGGTSGGRGGYFEVSTVVRMRALNANGPGSAGASALGH